MLLGWRARGDAGPGSDGDIGWLGVGVDRLWLRADLVDEVATDDVDLVPRARASVVLRRDAAVDGVVRAERVPGTSVAFQVEAVTSWADVEPVVREAHDDVVRALVR